MPDFIFVLLNFIPVIQQLLWMKITHMQLLMRVLPICRMNVFAVSTRPSAKNCVLCLALTTQWRPSASFPHALCSSHSAVEIPFPTAAVQELPPWWIRNIWIAVKGEPCNLELLLKILKIAWKYQSTFECNYLYLALINALNNFILATSYDLSLLAVSLWP